MRRWLALALLAGACSPEGFVLVPTGVDEALRAVAVDGEGRVVAVGDRGTILEHARGELTVTSTGAPDRPTHLNAVVLLGRTALFAGDGGVLLARTGTQAVVREDGRTTTRLLALAPFGARGALAAGHEGAVIERDAEGRWRRVDTGAPRDAKITGAWSSGESVVLTTDGGELLERREGRWARTRALTETASVAQVPLFGVWSATTGADLVAVGLGGTVLRRAAGEESWTEEPTPANLDLYAIHGAPPDRAYAVGARGTILRYAEGAWRLVPSGTGQDLHGVFVARGGRTVAVVGAKGTLLLLREE